MRTLENADSGSEVVDSAGSLEGGGDDRDGGDEIVGEGVVQVALFENVALVLACGSLPRLTGW